MRNIVLACFAVSLAFCPMAMASDIAISTQAGWMGQGTADAEAQKIVDNVKNVSIEVFTPTDLDALATWVQNHTGDGTPDLLIMFGNFPSTIYPSGNAQPDGSIAENFLDDGNCIINTGDYIFYVGSAGNNDAGGLQNMLDVPAAAMWGDDSGATTFTPTADGQLYTPSLPTLPSNRPWFPAQFAGTDWEFELILAQNSDGSQVHPAILHNTVTNGRVGVFFQYSDDSQPRGQVISEWVNNYFLKFIAAGNPYTRRPSPADASEITQSWSTLGWNPGDFAVSYDVYLSTNYDDVLNGTGDSFRGNITDTFFIVGFIGYPYPDGLVPGTTYYWRVDSVNPAEPDSPWKGRVWSFSLPALQAANPVPANGMGLVDLDADLTWKPGWNAILHYVNFGTDYDAVANAAAGTGKLVGTTKFDPGTMQPNTTYYWRVDESAPPQMHQGEVWSFTTESGKPGGLVGEYFSFSQGSSPADPFAMLLVTRVDKEINFNWGDPGSPDPLVPVDGFSARWTGDITIPFTDEYTIYGASDDGMRIWINGQSVVDAWVDRGTTETPGKIYLEAGIYPIEVDYYENGGGATAYLRWSSPHIAKEIVPEAALSPPLRAREPIPANDAVDVTQTPLVQWKPGSEAASHDVYFGTDPNAVAAATKTSPEYVGTRQLGNESYEPPVLAWNTSYYWRIDEVNAANPDSPWTGSVWNFTTANYGIVDDFEFYNDIPAGEAGSNLVYIAWVDGFDNPNVNGSTMGYITGASMETSNVHGGNQSVPFEYNNTVAGISEVTRTFTPARDWTANGVVTLSISFAGSGSNVPGQLYVKINDVQVNYTGDRNNLARAPWQVWNIDLTTVNTNLSNVTSLAIGVQGAGATGTLLLDDIRLYDQPGEKITPVQPGTAGLVAHLAFDGNANDSAGGHNGVVNGGSVLYPVGKIGQAIALNGNDNYVVVGSVGISGADPRTIAGWAKANVLDNIAWVDVFGFTGPSGNNGHFDIEQVGNSSSGGATLGWYGLHTYGWEVDIMPIDMEWHHLAASYDGTTTKWYGDGILVGSDDTRVLDTPDNVQVGKREDNTNFFAGQVDDVRIYNRVLSDEEVAGLAGITQPYDKPF